PGRRGSPARRRSRHCAGSSPTPGSPPPTSPAHRPPRARHADPAECPSAPTHRDARPPPRPPPPALARSSTWRSGPRLLGCGLPGATPEDDALEQAVAHHAVPSVRPARDLAARVEALERGLGVRVDHETAVLVGQHGGGEYLRVHG